MSVCPGVMRMPIPIFPNSAIVELAKKPSYKRFIFPHRIVYLSIEKEKQGAHVLGSLPWL